MTYTMYNEELREIISGECFEGENEKNECLKRKQNYIDKLGGFSMKESYYKNLCICNCMYNFDKDIRFLGKFSGDIICLTFIKKGQGSFQFEKNNNCILQQHTFNLFCFSGENNYSLYISKGHKNEGIDILMTKQYFLNLVNKFPQVFENLYRQYREKRNYKLFENGVYYSKEMQQIIEQMEQADLLGNCAPLLFEAKILELFSHLLNKENGKSMEHIPIQVKEKLLEARFILEQNYLSPPGIHELALQTGISATALKQYFKKLFNNTVYGYLFEFRMRKASGLLKHKQELNISEIAERTGYEHQTHFCTAFKRKFGISPREFRERSCCIL